MHTRIISAAEFSLETLADVFTRSFEQYFYPGTTSPDLLARRIRSEQLDLNHSLAIAVDDQPAGIALLGIRGRRAWCGGFGIMMPYRGKGLSHTLAQAMREHAKAAGMQSLALEVLTKNERAIKTYQALGLTIQRDLLIMDWKREDGAAPSEWPQAVRDVPIEQALKSHAQLHVVPYPWQRELTTLLILADLKALALYEQEQLVAYVAYSAASDEQARIVDVAATNSRQAQLLLQALQSRYTQLMTINEPSDSPLLPAFELCGFHESDRQHDMLMQL